ncbi:MAG: hypothetical protein ACYSW3_29060 [Planctomycetota bacterium]
MARLLHDVRFAPYKSRVHEDRIRKLRHELGNDELSEWEAERRAELGDLEFENRMDEARDTLNEGRDEVEDQEDPR